MRGAAGAGAAVALAALLAAAAAGAASGAPRPRLPSGEPVRLGVAGPLTGPHASMGHQIRGGVELAVAEWNSRGGVAGRPVVAVAADDRQDPRAAAEAARRLVGEGILAVVGHVGTETTLAAAPLYAAAGVLHLAPAATSARLTQDGILTLFRICGRDDDQGRLAAAFAAEELEARRAAVVHDGTDYGAGLAAAFRQAFGRRVRGGIVAAGALASPDRDPEALVARVREADPDVLFFAGLAGPAAQFRRVAWQADLRVPFLAADAAVDPHFVRMVGEAASAEAYFTFAPDLRTLPSAQAFLLMHSRLMGPPGPYAVYGYDAAGAALTALARAAAAGRLEGAAAARLLRARPYDGALGRLRWDARGELMVPLYVLYRVERGGPLQGWFAPATSLRDPGQHRSRARPSRPIRDPGAERLPLGEPVPPRGGGRPSPAPPGP